MLLKFSNEVWYWRGPAPFYFVTVPEKESLRIKEISELVTYGWGVIPVSVRVKDTKWTTSLFPKNGIYLVPVKKAVRLAEDIQLGDVVEMEVHIQ